MGKMLRNNLEKGQDSELKMVFYSEIPRVQFCSRWLMRNVEGGFHPEQNVEALP